MPFIAGAQLPPASPLLKIPERVETYSVFAAEESWRISKTYPPYGPCPDHTPDPAHADAQPSAHATPTTTALRLIVIPHYVGFHRDPGCSGRAPAHTACGRMFTAGTHEYGWT